MRRGILTGSSSRHVRIRADVNPSAEEGSSRDHNTAAGENSSFQGFDSFDFRSSLIHQQAGYCPLNRLKTVMLFDQ